MKFGAMADAKSGLNKNDEALQLLDKAASASSDPYTTYYFTRKAGILALGLKKNAYAKNILLQLTKISGLRQRNV